VGGDCGIVLHGDNYLEGVESVSVSTRAVRAFLFEELGYGEDVVYRCERLGL
jgi:hypothetical protein